MASGQARGLDGWVGHLRSQLVDRIGAVLTSRPAGFRAGKSRAHKNKSLIELFQTFYLRHGSSFDYLEIGSISRRSPLTGGARVLLCCTMSNYIASDRVIINRDLL